MILARIVGTVVATRKDPRLVSNKLLIVRPMDPRGKAEGNYLVAVDTVDAGTGETVLIVSGSSARMAAERQRLAAEAAEAALANAERAGVVDNLRIFQRALSSIEVPEGPGLLLVNPPYGGRVGDGDDLRNLYAQLGHVARDRCRGWTVGVLSADRALDRQVGLDFRDILPFRNGGIPVRLVAAVVPV